MSISIVGQLCPIPAHKKPAQLCLIVTDPAQGIHQITCSSLGYYCILDLTLPGEYTLYLSDACSSHPQLTDLSVLQQYTSFVVSSALLDASSSMPVAYTLNEGQLTPMIHLDLTSQHLTYVTDDTVCYHLSITNASPFPLTQLCIHDLLDTPLRFVPHSVVLDQCPAPDLSLLSGILLSQLMPSEQVVIDFQAQVLEMPSSQAVTLAQLTYDCHLPGSSETLILGASSSPHTLTLYEPCLSIQVYTPRNSVSLGDTIPFEIHLINEGSLDILHLTLDHYCPCCKILDETITVDTHCIHGFSFDQPLLIDYIPCHGYCRITFDAIVTDTAYACHEIAYDCHCTFMYHIPNHAPRYKKNNSYHYTLPLNPTIFKQCAIDAEFELPDPVVAPEAIHSLSLQICPLKHQIISTPCGTSLTGEVLTGFKLLVHLCLDYTVTYLSDQGSGIPSLYHFTVPFSTFLILPPDIHDHLTPCIHYTIRKNIWQILDSRCFLSTSYFLITVDLTL